MLRESCLSDCAKIFEENLLDTHVVDDESGLTNLRRPATLFFGIGRGGGADLGKGAFGGVVPVWGMMGMAIMNNNNHNNHNCNHNHNHCYR